MKREQEKRREQMLDTFYDTFARLVRTIWNSLMVTFSMSMVIPVR